MGEDLPAICLAGGRHFLGIDGHHDALVAELVGCLGNEIGVLDRRRIDRDLVGARQQQFADIGHGADPAADGQRHEAMLRRLRYNVEDGLAVVG